MFFESRVMQKGVTQIGVRIKGLILPQNSNWTGNCRGNCSGKLRRRSRWVPRHQGTQAQGYTRGMSHLMYPGAGVHKHRVTWEEWVPRHQCSVTWRRSRRALVYKYRNCCVAVDEKLPRRCLSRRWSRSRHPRILSRFRRSPHVGREVGVPLPHT